MPTVFSATYSPEDNKLRLYASTRLDPETYERVRAAGFIWAPKQKLFVAPMWTPERAELCEELAGDIGDEDTSLVDRAEQRAERFDEYSTKRAADSAQAAEAVRRITDGIPLGQPILVGHHSERHARRDANRIENGMRKAVKMWETAKYWTDRAAGALAHASYKQLPAVRARRIKGLEADQRKQVRNVEAATVNLLIWTQIHDDNTTTLKRADGATTTFAQRAVYAAGRNSAPMGVYSDLIDGRITPSEAQAIAIKAAEACLARAQRWLAHFENRLAYERAMLAEQGASALFAKKPRPAQLPLCNYLAPNGLDIPNMYQRGEMIHYPQVSMTQAEFAKIDRNYKGTRVVGNSHRVRTAMIRQSLACVFLTDAKAHTAPAPIERKSATARIEPTSTPRRADPTPADISAMRQSLRAGVSATAVPQLFPTPVALASRMVEVADIGPADRVLEPSAGTGAIPQSDAGECG